MALSACLPSCSVGSSPYVGDGAAGRDYKRRRRNGCAFGATMTVLADIRTAAKASVGGTRGCGARSPSHNPGSRVITVSRKRPCQCAERRGHEARADCVTVFPGHARLSNPAILPNVGTEFGKAAHTAEACTASWPKFHQVWATAALIVVMAVDISDEKAHRFELLSQLILRSSGAMLLPCVQESDMPIRRQSSWTPSARAGWSATRSTLAASLSASALGEGRSRDLTCPSSSSARGVT